MKRKLFMFLICAFSLLVINIQTSVSQVWVQRYNGTADSSDNASSMTVDALGNIYVTGLSLSAGGAYYDIVTIKYNSSGNVQWLQKYNGPGDSADYANDITIDASGNVYIAGSSYGIGSKSDFVTIKYNSSGVQQWVQRYNGPANDGDDAYALAVDASGNVYVTGTSFESASSYDYYTIKYNSAGVQQWAQRYNGPGNSFDSPSSLEIDNAGNTYIAGYSTGVGTSYDYLTIKYNSSGVQQWEQRYNGTGNSVDNVFALKVDGTGNVYITGFSGGSGTGNDYTTIKYNSAGVQQWLQTYNGSGNGNDISRSLAVDDSGNVYISGSVTGSSSGKDITTIKYNSGGVQQWLQTYNGTVNGDDEAYAITLDGSGNILVTGFSTGSGTGHDYATLKYNSAGSPVWLQRYNGPTNNTDEARSVAVDGSGFVYVAGGSRSATGNDYAIIKYAHPIGIQTISSETPENFSLGQNYPNPFNPVTNFKFQIPGAGLVKVTVFDISGRKVAELVNRNLSAGTYNVDFDASHLASGTYFYKLETKDFTEVKKMVLVK